MAYVSVSEFLKQYDWRDVGDLVADDDTQVSEAGLAADPNLAKALELASADVDAALLAGGRYSASDLATIAGDTTSSGYHLLTNIVSELAMYYLFRRRPSRDPDTLEYYAKIRDAHLERLRRGENIFGLQDRQNAGRVSVDGPTTQEYDSEYNLVRDRVRNYYPPRRTIRNR